MSDNLNNLIKSHIKDYLESAKVIDKFLSEQMAQVEVLKSKKQSGTSFEELKEDIIRNFENSQLSSFALEDMKGILAKLSNLYLLAKLSDIELGLNDEDKSLLEYTVEQHKQLCIYKEGKVEPKDKGIFDAFKEKTAEKYLTEESLLDIYNSI